MSLGEKFRSYVAEKIQTIAGKKKQVDDKVRTVFEAESEITDQPSSFKMETLRTENEGLAPAVDWTALPPHISVARYEDFKSAYLELLRGRGFVKAEEVLDKLLTNVRYLDQAATTEAIQTLGGKLHEIIGRRPYCFIYLGNGESKAKSGYWVGSRLQDEARLDGSKYQSPLSLGQVIEEIQAGRLSSDTQLIIADDLSIFWEQIADVMLIKLSQAVGETWLANTHVALIAGTDVVPGPQQHMLRRVASVSRVYRVETLDDMHLSNLPFGLGGYITFFAHHRVSDRFFTHLLRSVGWNDKQGQFHYLVDDMKIAPPYDPERFTTGSWSYKARTTPE